MSENLSPIHQMVQKNCLLKTRNFTENVWLVNFFCHPANSQFLMADFSFNIACKELKLHKLLNLISPLTFVFSSYTVYGHGFY